MTTTTDMRGVFGQFASGVTVVTCRTEDGVPHGATMTAFTPVSIEPRLCQVTVTRTARIAKLLSSKPFAVNILSSGQTDLGLHFAGRPNSTPVVWDEQGIAPTLVGVAATITCEPWAEYDGGDHFIVVGQVVAADVSDAAPLLYHRGNFHEIGRRTADAHWDGSSDDPTTGWFTAITAPRPFFSRNR